MRANGLPSWLPAGDGVPGERTHPPRFGPLTWVLPGGATAVSAAIPAPGLRRRGALRRSGPPCESESYAKHLGRVKPATFRDVRRGTERASGAATMPDVTRMSSSCRLLRFAIAAFALALPALGTAADAYPDADADTPHPLRPRARSRPARRSIRSPGRGTYDGANMVKEPDGSLWAVSAGENAISRLSGRPYEALALGHGDRQRAELAPARRRRHLLGHGARRLQGRAFRPRDGKRDRVCRRLPPAHHSRETARRKVLAARDGRATSRSSTPLSRTSSTTRRPASTTSPTRGTDPDGTLFSLDFIYNSIVRWAPDVSTATIWTLPVTSFPLRRSSASRTASSGSRSTTRPNSAASTMRPVRWTSSRSLPARTPTTFTTIAASSSTRTSPDRWDSSIRRNPHRRRRRR